MKEIKINTMTRPGTPNRNGLIYTKESYDRCIRSIIITGILIPVIIGKPTSFENETLLDKLTIPVELIIGYVSLFEDDYIEVNLLDLFVKDEKSKEIIQNIQNDTLRAYMCYLGTQKRVFSESSSGNNIIDIDRIVCFYLENNYEK